MRWIMIVPALALAGCAPKLIQSSEAGGVIKRPEANINAETSAMMEAHCKQYGKAPVVTGQNWLSETIRFECR